MTDSQLNDSRAEILKDYLSTGEILYLDNLEICLSSSKSGIYHVFSFEGKGPPYQKLHRDSINDLKLEEIARTLSIEEIKKIFVESRLLKRHEKLRKENFNPLNFENQC